MKWPDSVGRGVGQVSREMGNWRGWGNRYVYAVWYTFRL